MNFSVENAKRLWKELGDIPVNENMELDEVFNPKNFDAAFEVGTDFEEVWHWFEETFNISVGKDLLRS